MFAFRSRSAVTRAYSVPPRSGFSTAALLHQEIAKETSTSDPGAEATDPDADPEPRIPLSIQSVWYRPFRRKAEYGLPVCDLQIRSYSVRNLEFMCDFALRAAYYLNLPASGPVPLPRKTERWTVPRGHFVHKKSQENFERVTYKRLIQIKDSHPETVEIWLAYLKKHQFYGTGMKANVWGFEELGVGKRMNISLDNLRDGAMKPKWAHSGVGKTLETAERAAEILNSPEYRVLADKTDIDEAKRELLQAAPLETIESLEEASEAELDEAIQKVEEEAMKAEESKEEAEINAVDQIADEAAELVEEPIEFEAQPIDEVKVKTQTDPLGPSSAIEDVPEAQAGGGLPDTTATPSLVIEESKDVSDVPAEELFPTPIGMASPVSEAQPPATGEAKEISGTTSAQGSLAGPSEIARLVREEEPRLEVVFQDNTTTQTTPEVIETQKAEAGVETEVKKVVEETAVDGTTRDDAGEPKPEKED